MAAGNGCGPESLEILAELGIRFTILAPHQANRVRTIGGRVWRDVSGSRIDPTQAYEQRLPSGRKIALFFYDGPIARAVAFEGLLSSGEDLANRLNGAFSEERNRPQLVHIATDGESYGHHHRFGDMALAYALNTIESNQLAQLTNYGEYLERHPPTHQVEIIEKLPGVVFTASIAGGAIAAVTPAAIPAGTRSGAPHYAMRWINCVTPSLRPSTNRAGSF